jgi:tripartite-type tricarboxylate transporter receptor subunit TctC
MQFDTRRRPLARPCNPDRNPSRDDQMEIKPMLKFIACRTMLPLMAAAALLGGAPADAQTYPTRSIQVIVPFAGGSASDVVTRIVLERMGQSLGHRFIVDNRPGAGGNTGTAQGAKAAPDGYTIVMTTSGPLAANRSLFRDLGYDPEKDLEPIGLFATIPNIVTASAKLPVKTLPELIEYAKKNPKQNYGSVGVGSSQHLAGAYFEQMAGVELTHVPYRNIAQYGPDLISGAVPLGFQFLPNVMAPISSNDARALAVASKTRLAALPDVPTSAEAGLPGYESSGWLAFLGPKGMPKPMIDRLQQELQAAMKDETVLTRFKELGAQPTPSTPQELAQFIASETAKWRDIVTKGNIKLDQ